MGSLYAGSPYGDQYDTAFMSEDGIPRREETGEHGRGVRFASGAKRGSGKAAAKSKRLTGSAPLSDEFAHWHTNHLATDDLGDGEILQEERLPPVDPGEWAPVDVFDFSSLVNGGQQQAPVYASSTLRWKLAGVYLTILGDVLVDAFTEPLRSDDITVHVLTFSFLIFMRLTTLMAFCLLTADILYIRMALYEEYFSAFSPLFLTALVSFLFFIGVRTWYLFLVYEQEPHMVIWTQYGGLYSGLYAAARSVNVIYYGVLAVSAQVACQARFYTEECLKPRR
eukprot:jgi/Tetstr1/458809/TSEL_045193.t1